MTTQTTPSFSKQADELLDFLAGCKKDGNTFLPSPEEAKYTVIGFLLDAYRVGKIDAKN